MLTGKKWHRLSVALKYQVCQNLSRWDAHWVTALAMKAWRPEFTPEPQRKARANPPSPSAWCMVPSPGAQVHVMGVITAQVLVTFTHSFRVCVSHVWNVSFMCASHHCVCANATESEKVRSSKPFWVWAFSGEDIQSVLIFSQGLLWHNSLQLNLFL